MVTDVMQNKIGCAIDCFIVWHQNVGRTQNEGPSPVSEYWLAAEYLRRATETNIALMEPARIHQRLLRDRHKSLKDQLFNLSLCVGMSKPQIAHLFHRAGIGQIGRIRHAARMIVQEATSVTMS